MGGPGNRAGSAKNWPVDRIYAGAMDDHGNLSPTEQALEDAKQTLDALPPEEARRLIMQAGGMHAAIATLTELAESEDPTVREDARATLERFRLG